MELMYESLRENCVLTGRNLGAQKGFVSSTCYANIVTVEKMLSLIEERNKITKPRIGLSALGLQKFAKMSGITGWESGTVVMFICSKIYSLMSCLGKFTRYMRIVNGISNEAKEVLKEDDDLRGNESVYSLKALLPRVPRMCKFSPLITKSSCVFVFVALMNFFFAAHMWLDFDPSEQVLYLRRYAELPVREQTAEGAAKLSQKIADRKVRKV